MTTKVRNVRINDDLDEKILVISTAEDRRISNTIPWLLKDAVERYLSDHPTLAK